ncbi:kinase-like domain-containing protein [Pisolithus marmoratus]|nr:kinase-like domain-containing protein [Pisolithus marmoratus]
MALLASPQHALDEITIWSQLRHCNITTLLGITTKFDPTVSMVTEWMERGNARDYVNDVVVDPRPLVRQSQSAMHDDNTVAQFLDIAHGLNYLHGLGIVHGDLKGRNVLISGLGRALVTDFGCSYRPNPSPGLSVDPPRGGSVRWLAPENLDTYAISQKADIWAYGITVLELFSRKDPFPEANKDVPIMRRISEGPPSRPSDELTCFRLSDRWWSMCLECWNSEPSARPTIKDIMAKIEELSERGEDEQGVNNDSRGELTACEKVLKWAGWLWARLRQFYLILFSWRDRR